MALAESIMLKFAENTGINSNKSPRRYLWTDSFAVCNFIELYNQTNDEKYKELAKDLVQQVHNTLGKYREDDEKRSGWLSSKDSPTKNGLRIGKPLPERSPGEPIDQRLEWERDGQYFHYLTKWMIALVHMGNFLRQKKYFKWGVDLLNASRKFIRDGKMFWKMSIDLSRPLIKSMGQHDPLNGYVTYKVVNRYSELDLKRQIQQIKNLVKPVNFATNDPLGIGEILTDAYRLYQMQEDKELISEILEAAEFGLRYYNFNEHGLAFRELGLAIGLTAAEKMDKFLQYREGKKKLNQYWVNHRNWEEHKDINQVMLVTSLIPTQYLST